MSHAPIAPALDPSLARYREQYPILSTSVYMNSNSMGAMHRGSAEALREYTQVWAREGVEAWDHWPAFINEPWYRRVGEVIPTIRAWALSFAVTSVLM